MSTLRYSQLTVNSAPGFEQGGFSLDELGARINIIYGPNAAGKTTAARAMQLLLWPQKEGKGDYPRRSHVEGRLETDEHTWFAEYDRGNIRYQIQGAESGRPDALLSPEVQPRYSLALHELLQAGSENKDFAELIRRESVGGFDIDAAAEAIVEEREIKGKRIGEFKRFEKANKHYREVRGRAEQLQSSERELEELRRAERAQSEAVRLQELYRLLQRYKERSQRIRELEAALKEFPPALENFTEGDAEQAREVEGRIADLQKTVEEEARSIEELSSRLAELQFTPSADFKSRLDTWKEKVETLKQRRQERRQQETKLEEAHSKVEECYADVAKALESADWEGLKADELPRVKELRRRAEDLRAASKAIGEQLKRLPDQAPAREKEVLQRGLRSLAELLLGYRRGFPKWLTATGAVTLLLAVAAALYYSPAALPLAAIGGLCFLIALVQMLNTPSRAALIKRYTAHGLAEFIPERWDEESLKTTLEQLAFHLGEDEYLRAMQQRREELKKDRDEQEQKEEDYRQAWRQLREQLGALPDFLDDEYGLSWLLDQSARLRRALDEKKAAEAGRNSIDEEIREILAELQQQWTPWHAAELTDVETAIAGLKQLNDRYSDYTELRKELEHSREKKADKEKQIEKEKTAREKLYARLGLGEETAPLQVLRRWEEMLPEYQRQRQELRDQRRDRESVLLELRDSEHFEERFLEEKLDAVKSHREHYAGQAERLEETRRRIAEIETNLNNEKRSHDLEEALAERDAAAAQLAERRDRNFKSLAADVLVQRLQERVRRRERPEVFHEASRLFERLTLGQFSLELEEAERPTFRAVDTARGKTLSLEQLSSGTRIQLLLAVRVAFLSRSEQGLQLPLFVDEVLANSDDERARIIIETLLRIAEEGRQIFYFTAQGDEVARWRQVLEDDAWQVDYRITSLRPAASESRMARPQEAGFSRAPAAVSEPGRMSHGEYGKKLAVPRYNPLVEPPEAMHIWYLIEDPELIYRLTIRTIDRLGALRTFLGSGGRVDGSPEYFLSALQEKQELLREAVRLYRIGRDIPVPFSEIEESGAVTARFIDQVRSLHHETGGDPGQLLERIAGIPKFQRGKLEELEEYLKEKGYISSREPYTPEEFQARLQAHISKLEHVEREEAETLLQRVFGSDPLFFRSPA